MCNDYKLNLFIDSSFLTELVGNGIITERIKSKEGGKSRKKEKGIWNKLSSIIISRSLMPMT